MQRRGYVPSAAALLAALLVGCTSGSGNGTSTDDSKGGGSDAATSTASSGKHQGLPDPCRAVDQGALDTLLPGAKELPDERRRAVYEGAPTVTYDIDRRGGCRWKFESSDAVRRLHVDFERVVSYDDKVSDDERAESLYVRKETAAGLPSPQAEEAEEEDPGGDPSDKDEKDAKDEKGGESEEGDGGEDEGGASDDPSETPSSSSSPSADSDSDTDSDAASPTGLEPRTLSDLADQAFLDDRLKVTGSAARLRTVTVVFRTSNVLVTVEYDEQPTRGTTEPSSKELQDRARKLASGLAGKFS
ncbi:DUF3558 domain-containing protein [Streptomyces apocyni]|uniref:DUF3558 domain-containing protein n=1 Tax=Streptomyces apocyni TaxID=2654677 RepID=UPI0012EA7A42|nr:DUF3558 domain-containing protein [Streptomyces apocyni]